VTRIHKRNNIEIRSLVDEKMHKCMICECNCRGFCCYRHNEQSIMKRRLRQARYERSDKGKATRKARIIILNTLVSI
jgi:hypothetical protein